MSPILTIIFLAVPQGGAQFERCELCHTTGGWHEMKSGVTDFDHAATGFPLRGAHLKAPCNDCHGERPLKGPACVQCHVDEHRGEKSRTCDACHASLTWRIPQARRDHRGTRLPLVGRHAGVPCRDCHSRQTKDQWRAVPADCASCHARQVAQAGLHPDHRGGVFQSDCGDCHTVFGWRPARVAHARFWPLTGAHRTTDCARCHPGGRYERTPERCRECHQTAFLRGHRAGSSEECGVCHSTRAWKPANNFDHSRFFPVPHRGVRDCASCHPKGTNDFSCLTCHTHGESAMNSKHRRVGGYAYQSSACLRCHSRGRE